MAASATQVSMVPLPDPVPIAYRTRCDPSEVPALLPQPRSLPGLRRRSFPGPCRLPIAPPTSFAGPFKRVRESVGRPLRSPTRTMPPLPTALGPGSRRIFRRSGFRPGQRMADGGLVGTSSSGGEEARSAHRDRTEPGRPDWPARLLRHHEGSDGSSPARHAPRPQHRGQPDSGPCPTHGDGERRPMLTRRPASRLRLASPRLAAVSLGTVPDRPRASHRVPTRSPS